MCANNGQKWWFHFVLFCWTLFRQYRERHKRSSHICIWNFTKANNASVEYRLSHWSQIRFYYETDSKKKVSRKWMQPSKMHCWFFFGFASSRDDEIAQYMKNFRLFVLLYILVCIRLLSLQFSRKRKQKKNEQPSRMQEPKSILGAFLYDDETICVRNHITFLWLWFSIGVLRKNLQHSQHFEHKRHAHSNQSIKKTSACEQNQFFF